MKIKHLGVSSSDQSYKDKFLILDPINRAIEQNKIDGINIAPYGLDIWNAYEFSYLDSNKKPCLKILEIKIPSNSSNTIESKSLKLYLNSFYDQSFKSDKHAIDTIKKDLEKICDCLISIDFINEFEKNPISISLISKDLKIIKPNDTCHFEGFRSICPVTGQPDWATIYMNADIPIDTDWLINFLISFRNIGEFHELCIDKIYSKLNTKYNPNKLTVYGRFLRRGGIDINPLRSSSKNFKFKNHREFNQ